MRPIFDYYAYMRMNVTNIFITMMVVVMTAISARVCAQDEVLSIEDTVLVSDTIVNNDPEWYVAPLEYSLVRAPKRAAVSACPIDSVRTFNVDSVLESVSIYEYGDTTRTMVWTVNPDGTRYGSSRTEEGTNGNITFSASYDWDATAGDWKGTNKEEHTYTGSRETLRTLYDWVNGAWSAKTQYAWTYDAAGRELEYTAKDRNASGKLAYSKQRLHEYNAAGKTLLEINYTAHNGSDWSAGTKKVYDYDAAGNQVLYEYYSAYTNGAWVGSSKEIWTYTAGKKTYYEKDTWSNGAWVGNTKDVWEFNGPSSKQTLHEKYGWSNGAWAITLQENSGYDAVGNNNLVENYTYANGVKTGSKKEKYAFSGSTKVETITYKWANDAWVENVWTINNKTSNPAENCKYNWNVSTNSWVGSGNRTLTTNNSSNKPIEVITQSWSTGIANWVNASRKTAEYSGTNTTQEATYTWSTETNDWVGTSRSDWHYNAKGQNDTIKTYTNNGADWIYSNRTVKTYNAAGEEIIVHNAEWQNDAWVMTSMTRADIETDEANRQTLYATWHCDSDSIWIGDQVDSTRYTQSGKVAYRFHGTSWTEGNWVPSYKIEYEYDDAGRVLSQEQKEWVKNAWQGYYRYEYKYDAEGRQTAYASYNGWSDVYDNWVGTTKTETVCDSQGLIVESSRYTWKNNDWLYSQKSSYAYDGQKRIILYILQSYVNGEWVNASKNEKGYCGEITSKDNTYIWLNNEWVYSSRNEAYYDDNAQAKLRREVIGSWSSGALVSFEDNYYCYACDPRPATIRFENEDGTLLESKQVMGGIVPIYTGETPTKPANAQYTYTFAGWDKDLVPVTGEETYTAKYDSVVNTYLVTFKNGEQTLQSEPVAYGTTPSYTGGTPTIPATAEYTYTFIGWDVEPVAVTGEATYSAKFDSIVNTYLVTFMNGEEVLQSSEIAYGTTPSYTGGTPTKPATAEYTYTFSGWDVEPVAVTGEATYSAKFDSIVNTYLVTFMNGEQTLQSEPVAYGTVPQYTGVTPTKPATAEYSYTFAGWDVEPVAVTGEATYSAKFDSIVSTYLVTFMNGEEVLQSSEMAYGATPSYTGGTPTKPATAEYTYTYLGWDKTIAPVTGDATYTARYDSVRNKYTVTFYFDDGKTVVETMVVEYGQVPTVSITPSKIAEEHYYYTFAGWEPALAPVTGNASYTAVFNVIPQEYLITFKNDNGTVLQKKNVPYGTIPEYTGATPTKQRTQQYSYAFSGWSPELTEVSGAATYIAQFEAVLNQYTIVFINEDGTELDRQEVAYGTKPVYQGETPTKADDAQYTYTFKGWSPSVVTVTKATTYRATYTRYNKPQGLGDVQSDNTPATKVLRNGTLYILRAGKTYTTDGVLIEQ